MAVIRRNPADRECIPVPEPSPGKSVLHHFESPTDVQIAMCAETGNACAATAALLRFLCTDPPHQRVRTSGTGDRLTVKPEMRTRSSSIPFRKCHDPTFIRHSKLAGRHVVRETLTELAVGSEDQEVSVAISGNPRPRKFSCRPFSVVPGGCHSGFPDKVVQVLTRCRRTVHSLPGDSLPSGILLDGRLIPGRRCPTGRSVLI